MPKQKQRYAVEETREWAKEFKHQGGEVMRCPDWINGGCERSADPYLDCDGCKSGYIKYWSDAERAGLKALGAWVVLSKARYENAKKTGDPNAYIHLDRMISYRYAAISYVQASIKAKGGAFNKLVGSDKVNKEDA